MSDFPYTPEQLAWLEALESGKYKQGRKVLRDDDGNFCCLGVACELAGLKLRRRFGQNYYGSRFDAAPPSVVRRLRLRGNLGSARKAWDTDLAEFNDKGETFAEIAAIIRANPSEYFTNLDGEDHV